MRMLTALLLTAAIATTPEQAALADYAAQPVADQPYLRYLSAQHTPQREHEWWGQALAFAVPSASRAVVLDHQIPVEVAPALWRINLKSLDWDWRDFNTVLERYPYEENNPDRPLLVVRADWLVFELSDTTESQAYYLLLYGSQRIPKTRDEFFGFWSVDLANQPKFGFGMIEERSGVAHQRVRWLEAFESPAGYAWETKDVLRVEDGSDPLAAPDGKFKFDGSELIVGIPKVSLKYRTRGALQAYFLAAGNGARVEEAPVDLVEDHSRFKNQTAIRTSGSCIQCHEKGIINPTQNGLVQILSEGVTLKVYSKEKQEAIERFHLTDSAKEIARNQQDYLLAIHACNGLSGAQNVKTYRWAIQRYDVDLTPQRAALELYCRPEELQNALAYASLNKVDIGVRLAGLAHGRTIPRFAWEQDYAEAEAVLRVWRLRTQ